MKKNFTFGVFIGVSLILSCSKADESSNNDRIPTRLAILPQPQTAIYDNRLITLPKDITISSSIPSAPSLLLKQTLTESLSLSISDSPNDQAYIRIQEDASLKDEAYTLSIDKTGIVIGYATEQGLLWGVQSLRQALEQVNAYATDSKRYLPTVNIKDSPQYAWRGFHIDVARHMFTTNYLKKVIDCLSFYKINKLHLHLTDDQGWRIEIKKYPLLTQQGAWRDFDEYDQECIALSANDASFTIDPRFINGGRYGGFYTQEELKELAEYAAERGIEIVPEIDMPGHFSAAIKAYPELSCTGTEGWGKEFSYPICPSQEETYTFVESVIDEVADLFPSHYFHIGLDEVEKDTWTQCKKCQSIIEENRLGNTEALQNLFVKHIADYVRAKGKTAMGWDDAFYEEDPQDLIYTFWRDWKSNQPALITQKGFSIIFMEWNRFYLSATPSDDRIKAIYNFEFEPQVPNIAKEYILGLQACVWTERIPNERKFGEHVFPAMQAFAELAWGSERSWSNFTSRLPWHLKWLKSNDFYYTQPGFL
jgi:hexosaminidase